MFPIVYHLIELTLLLPVVKKIVEGDFLATMIIKIELHKQDFHNGCTNFNIILM
jgi:hypothetical protein